MAASDLGESTVAADGRCALVSFITSPLVVNRENNYVVFVTDAALAGQANSIDWAFSENGGTASSQSSRSVKRFTPRNALAVSASPYESSMGRTGERGASEPFANSIHGSSPPRDGAPPTRSPRTSSPISSYGKSLPLWMSRSLSIASNWRAFPTAISRSALTSLQRCGTTTSPVPTLMTFSPGCQERGPLDCDAFPAGTRDHELGNAAMCKTTTPPRPASQAAIRNLPPTPRQQNWLFTPKFGTRGSGLRPMTFV